MLQKQTVKPALLELLNFLMHQEIFKGYYLVGGTSLALQLGHRESVDIDLFGNEEINEIEFTATLSKFGTPIIIKKSKNIIVYSVSGIKLDIVNYNYRWLKPAKLMEHIRFASFEDIGAMKLNAIAGRGSKKDFIDLYLLLQEFTLKDLISFYKLKYTDGSEFLVLKSLTYFEDADLENSPKMYLTVTWDTIKQVITNQTLEYLNK